MGTALRLKAAVLHITSGGVLILVPPRGFWRSAAPMFCLFALLWWGLLVGIGLNPFALPPGARPVIGFLFAIALWLFGIPALAIAVLDARKQARIGWSTP
jgi:hypothetical protein